MKIQKPSRGASFFYGGVLAALTPTLLFPVNLQAQALEEIVVTAQRREQSIQEVPISLEAYSGVSLNQEGFRTMEDLSNFSPSVEIDVRTQDQDVSVRGLGTTGNNLGLEAAVPIFVDGVHFARTSMIMGAFLDLERIEVLRGPQPIAFGQNATAGAFSLTTKGPTPEWEGDVTAEYGNWERFSLEGGIGGPINDTWGIRLAGQYDKTGGYIKDVVSSGKFPSGEEAAARMTLQWRPTEQFGATFKAEWAQRRNQAEGNSVCRTAGDVEQTERAVTIPGQTIFTDAQNVLNFPTDCDTGFKRIGIQEGRIPFARPVQGIDQEDGRGGIVDISAISAEVMQDNGAHDDMDAYNYRLGLDYEFDNGITMTSNTAYIDYQRSTSHDNSSSPIPTNLQHRGEIFDMVSQEFRFGSPRGGQIEWEAGAFYQKEDLDLGNLGDPKYSTITIRANIRRAARSQIAWQDSEWMSAFGSFTFNFMDDKASLDVGARYTDISKHSYIQGFAQTYIYDVNPIDHPVDPIQGDGLAQGTQHDSNDRIRDVVSGIEDDPLTGDPRNGIIDCGDFTDNRRQQCGAYEDGFYTHAWQVRTVPEAWDTRRPVGIGPALWGIRREANNGIYDRVYNDNSLDPQVTLRYRPTDNLSLYGKWARAFKGGGADISTASLPDNQESFPLGAEKAENFELGAKGTLLDGRANFNLTLFQITIKGLQIATTIPDALDTQNSRSTNAGKQRTRGIEFDSRWAVTDQLTLGFSGALMDGKMVKFEGAGCTDAEFAVADTGPCISEQESIDLYGDGSFEGIIDRSGARAPRTPKYKAIVDVDWWYPITDRLKYTFSSKTSFIDGYVYNVEDFNEVIKYDDRIVQNLNIGLADMDDRWNVSLWGRNLFDAGFKYFPEFDVAPEGRQDKEVSSRHWFSYGIQFQYFYN